MEKVRNFVFIFLLILLFIARMYAYEETVANSDLSYILESDVVFQTIDDVCTTIDECKLECCALNMIYFTAKNNCFNSTDIDEQLAEVKLNPVFSPDHKRTCDSVCSANVDDNETKMEEEDFKIFMHNFTSNLTYFCNNFVDVCFNYSLRGQHFQHLGMMDPIRRFWLPLLGMILSFMLLSFTLTLYLAVPKLCRRIQDKCFLFHLSFRIAYIIMYLVVLFSLLNPEDFSCKFYAFLFQFLELSAAFWLNIICYHLWRCIVFKIPANQTSSWKLRYYSMYACGCSCSTSILTILADWLPDEYDSYKPYIGEERCTIKGYDEYIGTSMWLQPKFIYNYSIQIIIQIINFVAFLHIVNILSSRKKLSKKKGNVELRSNQIHQLRLLTYVKLFLLMGLTTVLDIIVFHVGRSTIQKLSPIFVSSSFIFVIFVCKKRVFRLVKERYLQLTSSQANVQYIICSRTGAMPTLSSTGLTKLE